MKRKITGFHLDEINDWIEELEYNHGQHVRHNPPFVNRPWVVTLEGRNSNIGESLRLHKMQSGRSVR
jgi:hypothetical protein